MLNVMNAADHWWAFALQGIAAVVFGIPAFIWPGVTLAVLVLLWGMHRGVQPTGREIGYRTIDVFRLIDGNWWNTGMS